MKRPRKAYPQDGLRRHCGPMSGNTHEHRRLSHWSAVDHELLKAIRAEPAFTACDVQLLAKQGRGEANSFSVRLEPNATPLTGNDEHLHEQVTDPVLDGRRPRKQRLLVKPSRARILKLIRTRQ